MSFADDLDVFYGRVTQTSAQVYVRVTHLPGGSEWSLRGTVRGPFWQGVRTLPLTMQLQDTGDGSTLLAGCAIPDPATWSPLSPSRYQLRIELRRNGKTIAEVERLLGIRTLGTNGRDLRWEGKRWVLRGICQREAVGDSLADFREQNAVPILSAPSDNLLEQASAEGVLAAVESSLDVTAANVRQLASFACVGMIIMPTSSDTVGELKASAPNVLFAQVLGNNEAVADWADVAMCDVADECHLKTAQVPLIAVRRFSNSASFSDARAACDRLQRDLVSIGDFAGYVV